MRPLSIFRYFTCGIAPPWRREIFFSGETPAGSVCAAAFSLRCGHILTCRQRRLRLGPRHRAQLSVGSAEESATRSACSLRFECPGVAVSPKSSETMRRTSRLGSRSPKPGIPSGPAASQKFSFRPTKSRITGSARPCATKRRMLQRLGHAGPHERRYVGFRADRFDRRQAADIEFRNRRPTPESDGLAAAFSTASCRDQVPASFGPSSCCAGLAVYGATSG